MIDKATGSITLDEIVARVSTLATLPDVYLRIKRILDDPASTHADVGEALQTDPAMAARLLRVANSAFYGRPGTITTITRAVGLLGTQQVHDLVLAAAVMQSFDGLFPEDLKPRDFWRASVTAATHAKLLAEHCSFLDAERMFVAGLLAQVGQLVLLEQLPVQMGSLGYLASQSGRRLCELQRDTLGFDYADVSGALFAAWNLPEALIEPIRRHTSPSMAEDHALEAAIVHIAVEAADAEIAQRPLEYVLERIDDGAWQRTGMSRELFEQMCGDASELAAGLMPALLDQAA
jgi:HD-like signal output (HDOD) protein